MTIDISPEAVDNPCTCHPDDQPPKPCPQKYALTECRIAALSPALAALAMRERAAKACDDHAAKSAEYNLPQFSLGAAQCRETIRALPTTFTDAELLAAAMQLPEVRALVDVANAMKPQLERRSYESLNMYTGKTERHFGVSCETWSVFCAALAPFTKGAP